jgi:tetraacyldisaccharide 4'-kinase
MAVVVRLAARGVAAHVVSRGLGGSLAGPVRVEERRHTAAEVGDEPLLLAAFAPVWVARDRAAAARAAEAAGAAAVVMDDGLQNPDLAKDLSLVVVDAGYGFGNGRVIPAGPLREPVAAGLARADLVIAIGSPAERARFRHIWPGLPLPILGGTLAPLPTGMDWAGLRALAFAGIGRPEKFFATLRALGVDLAAARSFSDHEPFAPRALSRLEAEATASHAQLVTTEKDAARLPPSFRAKVLVLPVRLELEDWTALDAALARLGL